MKKRVLLFVFAGIVSAMVYAYSGGAAAQNGTDGTGASGAGGCGNCHGSTTSNATKVELDSAGVLVTSYHPGMPYTIKISATNATGSTLPRFGFQLVAVKSVGAGTNPSDAGTWGTNLPANVQNTPASASGLTETIIEQYAQITATSGTGANGTTYVESIPWTAPAAGTGSVKIYGVINAVNYNGSSSGDKYQAATAITITEAVAAPVVAGVTISLTSGTNPACAGSSLTFTATPINGGSAPTYQWKVNGTNAATGSTFTTSSLTNGQVVTCVMTSNLAGVTGNPATSTGITVAINPSVTPAVSILPSVTSTCTGGSVTFTAAPVNGGTSPTYQWKKNGSAIGGATASTYSTTTLASGDLITVDMTSNAACASPATVTSSSVTITITGTLVPAVSIVSNGGNSICAGQSVIFTATPTNGGNTPTYQWTKNGSNIGGATSPTYTTTTLVNGDVIGVVMTSSSSCASPATATSNTITMTIVTNAVASVSISANPGNTICTGQSVTFTATPVNGGTIPTYQWKKNGTNINGATSSTYTSSSLLNGDVITVQMTSNSQCVISSTATSSPVTITITSGGITPSVSIISNASGSVCSGQNVTFTATPVNGGSTPSYQWLKNGTNINGATSSAYSSTTLVNGDVISVVLTSSSSCASPTTATSNTITANITTNGVTLVSISSTIGTSVCTGQSVTFIATPVNGGSTPSYQWQDNGIPIAGATGSTNTFSALSNGDVITVIMTSSSQCVTQRVVTSNVVAMNVSPGGAPLVSISSSTGLNICQGSSATYTAVSVYAGSSPAYQWQKNGTNVGSNTTTYLDASVSTGDIITCHMTSSLSCASPATAVSNSLHMNVYSLPAVTITVNNNSLVATQAYAYQWYLNNIAINGATAQILNPVNNGSYTVGITDDHGCQNTSTAYDVTFAGVNEISPLSTISVYPNPVEGTVYVDLTALKDNGKVVIRISDTDGRLLVENAEPVAQKVALDLHALQNGIYLVQISQGDASTYRKLVVSR